MLDLIGKVIDGHLKYPPNAEELYMRTLSESEGKLLRVRISRSGPIKTHKQLGAYFGLAVASIREAMIDRGWSICGVAPNQQMIHEILSQSCGGVGMNGQVKRVSQMSIEEMAQFFDNVRDWAAQELHVVIPDPRPDWKDKK